MSSIVVLTPWFPNRPGERVGSYIYDSAAAVARAGDRASVLVCRPYYPQFLSQLAPEWTRGPLVTESFKELDCVALSRYASAPGEWLRPCKNYLQKIAIRSALTRFAKQRGASLIHAQTEGMAPVALEVANELGIPAVATIHGLNTDPKFLHASRQQALLPPALRGMNRLILVGEPLREFFASYAGRGDHIRIVANGVELPGVKPQRVPFGFPIVQLISVSNLVEGKGIEYTLDALALLDAQGIRNWAYTIIGDGEERAGLADRVQRLGIGERVKFRGALAPRHVFEALNEADVFVLPSYREAFGIAYLEAMSCGLVTIGVKGQGPAAFIENGISGCLVEPKNAQDVAAAIRQAIADPVRARTMGEKAKAVAQSFSWDAHARNLMHVYEEALADGAR